MQSSNSDILKESLYEKLLFFFDEEIKKKSNKKYIIGVDEVGRGPLAGPVVAAASIIFNYSDWMNDINDSKKISHSKREEIFKKMIFSRDIKLSFSYVDNYKIDEINILNASLLAMKKAVEKLVGYLNLDKSDFIVVVDGNKKIKDLNYEQISVVRGDSKSVSVAAASIFAKVIRDRWMDVIHIACPHYDFKKHKGYPTKKHIEMIKKYGISPYHRKSFSPCNI